MIRKVLFNALQTVGSHIREHREAWYAAAAFSLAALAACVFLFGRMSVPTRLLVVFLSPCLGFLFGDEYRCWRDIRRTEPVWVKTNQAARVMYLSDHGPSIRLQPGSKRFELVLVSGPLEERMVVHASLEFAIEDANKRIRSSLWRLHLRKRFLSFSFAVVCIVFLLCVCALFVLFQ